MRMSIKTTRSIISQALAGTADQHSGVSPIKRVSPRHEASPFACYLRRKLKKPSSAPHAECLVFPIVHRGSNEFIIDWPIEPRLQPISHQHEGREAPVLLGSKAQRMLKASVNSLIEIGAEAQALPFVTALDRHRHGEKWRILHMNQGLLSRRHQIELAVVLESQHRGEELDQRFPANRAVLVIPGAVAPDSQANVAAF